MPESSSTITSIGAVALTEGDRYIAYREIEDLATSASRNMLIRNPSGSGIIVALDAPLFDATGRVDTELVRNPDVTDFGTEQTPHNARVGEPDNSTAEVYDQVTYTGGTFINQAFAGSGGGGTTAVAGQQAGIGLLINPDNDVLIRGINNTNAVIARLHIEADFSEFNDELVKPSA